MTIHPLYKAFNSHQGSTYFWPLLCTLAPKYPLNFRFLDMLASSIIHDLFPVEMRYLVHGAVTLVLVNVNAAMIIKSIIFPALKYYLLRYDKTKPYVTSHWYIKFIDLSSVWLKYRFCLNDTNAISLFKSPFGILRLYQLNTHQQKFAI